MGLFDWFSKDKKSIKSDHSLNDLASSLRQLDEICQEATGAHLAYFNARTVVHSGMKVKRVYLFKWAHQTKIIPALSVVRR